MLSLLEEVQLGADPGDIRETSAWRSRDGTRNDMYKG
jgi:hypothetical protein